jgi:CBS domain-containing protein
MVQQIMQDAVWTVSQDTKGSTVAEILTERNFGSLPVVKEDRTLVGLISEFDLLRVMDQEKDLREVTAADIMTRDVVTVTEDMPVRNLIHLLQERHLIRVPVVKGKTLVGVVARRDALFGYVKATAKYWP